MKKIILLLSTLCMSTLSLIAVELANCDFESGQTATAAFGATTTVVTNPVQDAINGTSTCLKIGRTSTAWYELADIPVTEFTVPASGKCYLHMLVKSDVAIDMHFRPNTAGSPTIAATNTHTGNGEWQDVIFDLGSDLAVGFVINNLRIIGDNFQALNNTDKFAYYDEIVVNEDPLSRIVTIPESINEALCNFESTEVATPEFGATSTRILNPLNDSNNSSDSCLQVGRTSANYWELFDVAIDEFVVPSSEKCYVHVMVKSSVALDVSLRPNKEGSPDIRAANPYSGDGEWQDLVFDLAAHKDPGYIMNNIRLLTDIQKVLDNSTTLAYFDEIIVNEDMAPRIINVEIPATIDSTISTFEDPGYDWVASSGASITKVFNTDNSGSSINTTDSCLEVGDTKATYYALMDYVIDLVVPSSECYLHVMAKSKASPNITLRTMPDNDLDIMPTDSLIPNEEWQDLVFDISGNKYAGYEIEKLRIMLDFDEKNLNTTDSLLYIDEIIISESPIKRTSTPTELSSAVANQIMLYPNPVENVLFVSDEDVKHISMFNLSGQQVLNVELSGTSIELGTLEQGLYFVQCKDAGGQIVSQQSIIKK